MPAPVDRVAQPGEPRDLDVASETTAGLIWTGAGETVVQPMALARLLTPADFGLVGRVVVVSGCPAVFSEIGFSAALTQREQIEERHRSKVLGASLALGTAESPSTTHETR